MSLKERKFLCPITDRNTGTLTYRWLPRVQKLAENFEFTEEKCLDAKRVMMPKLQKLYWASAVKSCPNCGVIPKRKQKNQVCCALVSLNAKTAP